MLVLQHLPLQVRTVVHAIHMCHSLLVRLSPEVLEKVAYLMWNLLALSTAEFMDLLLETDDTGVMTTGQSTQFISTWIANRGISVIKGEAVLHIGTAAVPATFVVQVY
jgi:hypothetical protein